MKRKSLLGAIASFTLLSTTGSKVPKWMDFVQRFRPIAK